VTDLTQEKVQKEWTSLHLGQDIFAFHTKLCKLIWMITDGKQLTDLYRDHNVCVDYVKNVPNKIWTLILNNIHQRKDLR
jgi:hypothetical protein